MRDETASSYMSANDRAIKLAGRDWSTWNARYVEALREVGLKLVPWDKPLRPPSSLIYAPQPTRAEEGPHWPLSLLVLANDLPWFYRYTVGELVRISLSHPGEVVPWAMKLCGPLQASYTDLFADVLATREKRLLAFSGGLAKL